MQNMILKHFRGCWERIYVFSPTAVLDKSTWDPVRKHLQEDLGIDLVKEPAFFEGPTAPPWTGWSRSIPKLSGSKRSAVISNFSARFS